MNIERRRFLERAMLAGLLPATTAVAESLGMSITPTTPRLLVVMLRGACDTDSLLFQYNNSFYYDSRPNIAIARSGIAEDSLRVDDTWALHPSLAPIAPLLATGELALVPFSGSDDTSRSHFQAQEIMEAGVTSKQKIGSTPGWLNRIVQEMKRHLPSDVAFGGTNFGRPSTLICRGPADIPDLSLAGNELSPRGLESKADILMQLYDAAGYTDRLMAVKDRRLQLVQDRMLEKNHGAQFGNSDDVVIRFRKIGRLMKQGGGFSVGFVDVNGWDTHVGQGAESGLLATKFRQFALGLDAFKSEIGPVWVNTQIVVISEFGRTFRENGSRGTDHGRGTTLLMMSGKKFGSKLLGRTFIINDNFLNEKRDLPVKNNYREVISTFILPDMGLSEVKARATMHL